jgi:hypothetical protein
MIEVGAISERFTSPRRGEVDLLSAMRSIVRRKSGEGSHTKRAGLTPHSARSLSSGARSRDPLVPIADALLEHGILTREQVNEIIVAAISSETRKAEVRARAD